VPYGAVEADRPSSSLGSGTAVLGFLRSGRWPLALLESPGLDDDNDEHDHQDTGCDLCGVLMNEPRA
jgi:hypothetical protein